MSTQQLPATFSGRALSHEFHRWSRWYPARWREENEAAMLGTYLDVAESEDREWLRPSDKIAMLSGGIEARLDFLVPAAVRDAAATIALSLLGAFGLVVGLLFEWAPWNVQARAHWAQLYVSPVSGDNGLFGPFVSPFVLLCALAVLCFAASFIRPAWIVRLISFLTVLGGIALGLMGHLGVGHYLFFRGVPGVFVTVVAAISLLGRPVNMRMLLVGFAGWLAIFYVVYRLTASSWNPVWLVTPTDFAYWSPTTGTIFYNTPGISWLFTVALMLTALGFTFARRRRIAAVIVLSTPPWLVGPYSFEYNGGHATLELGLTVLGYFIAIIVAASGSRAPKVPSPDQTDRVAEV